ncbi:ubinuclein central domain protein [Rhizoctonia solani AG-3 Rhs1AP]|uniref:Ubinuclein central domain protein n=1 Tax=Rhizoctonia solani AG-3 Rhs1AP TaxID=1086054 RepID=X8IVF8_9AGAM|nr:ubinuclein central domain protein [Rhizoctonia solani AG-3 Rhs1AP]
MASSDHEMVDLTHSPPEFASTPHKDVPRAIIISSSVPTSRGSSPAAHSTPTRDRDFLSLSNLLARQLTDDEGATTDHATVDPPTSASVTPQTTPVTAPTESAPEAKPKKKKRRVSRSPSPPAPPPPMLTVRLEWNLPAPGTTEHNEAYAVNVREMSRETGQRHATPVPARRMDDDSDDEGAKGDTSAVEGAGKEIKKKRKKRREEETEYDLSDAFIDDSDLQRDSRTHFAQTKQQGFYVSSGEVALVKDKAVPKPRKRVSNAPSKPLSKLAATKAATQRAASSSAANTSTLTANTSVTAGNTSTLSVSNLAAALPQPQPMLTAGAPVYPRTPTPPAPHSAQSLPPISTPSNDPGFKSLSSFISDAPSPMEGNTSVGMKRQRTETNGSAGNVATPVGGKKARKTLVDTEPFSSALEERLKELHDEIKSYSWENKAKFPPNLKPRLTTVALEALKLGEYNENFFNYLPKIFPYNRFTMLKLTRRLMYKDHSELLKQRGETLLTELKQLVDQGLPDQEKLHADAIKLWESKQSSALAKWQEEIQQAQANHVPQEQLPPRPDLPAPPKRYKWNDAIKENVWQQVCMCNELAALANEAHGFDQNLAPKMSEQSLRKNLYQKIMSVFPEGWLTSNLISREVSEMKRKEKKHVDAGEGDDEDEGHA